jgi:hypothetical protein
VEDVHHVRAIGYYDAGLDVGFEVALGLG